jgi:cobalt-zinc-cadmium efflux system protein
VKNIRVAFFLNLGFALVEFIGGLLTNSTAILADAVHDLGDAFALGQAWYFEKVSQRKENARYTYGFRRFSLAGALISTVFLLISSFYILIEAIPRLLEPSPAHAEGMALLALLGIAVNGYAMLRLRGEQSINARTVGLHLLEDVLGWVAILLVAVALMFTDLYILDPILAVLITIYILAGVVKNVRAILPIFLQATPETVDVDAIQRQILAVGHVRDAHHIHVWSLDGQHMVFSAHLVADTNLAPEQYAALKAKVKTIIDEYGFYHSTVEIELPEETCRMSDAGPPHAEHDHSHN